MGPRNRFRKTYLERPKLGGRGVGWGGAAHQKPKPSLLGPIPVQAEICFQPNWWHVHAKAMLTHTEKRRLFLEMWFFLKERAWTGSQESLHESQCPGGLSLLAKQREASARRPLEPRSSRCLSRTHSLLVTHSPSCVLGHRLTTAITESNSHLKHKSCYFGTNYKVMDHA